MKNVKIIILLLSSLFILPLAALADAAAGDMIITLGENLSEEQKNALLSEMNAPEDAQIITVSNAEEHQYLGKYVAKSLIGTKAISSSAITIAEKNSGLEVESKNINWVTDEMYINALSTAGVKDAKIYITAPFEVSGTAALTGLIKAYEVSTDEVIPEDVKQAANEEMVKSAQLGDAIGTENASALMTKIKEEMAKNPPQTIEEIRIIVENAAKDLGLTLTEEQIQGLIDLFNKLKDLNIDWNQVNGQLQAAKDKIADYLGSEEGQGFLESIKQLFISLFDWIKGLFAK
ncbi:DUF1002 domain-containing protein [Bacillus benzoevorans]|uniref:Uncharacterized protein YpuA (DUF1002 family) n=1 Tax=Bacillus benzoevorans TaxID=1456 RepID=A0A7X0HSF7_9BACI|nr:DUF1002 domain-containing protein [Bacillus benzoevorans]MBB6444756.1 uncharacterized protein YpuA (DUF1002 family) [Bacillus benzoevorans]